MQNKQLKYQRRLFSLWIYQLCFIAGFINLVAIQYYHVTSSHHTGNVSQLAKAMITGDIDRTLLLLCLLFCFMLGGVISGLIFHQRSFNWQRPYGLFLVGLATIYTLAAYFISHTVIFIYLLTLISGILNSLCIYFRGTLVRTTHITGYLTDIGVEIGRWIRGDRTHDWRIKFYSLSIGSFCLGGCFALLCQYFLDRPYILCGGMLMGLAGIYYRVCRHHFDAPHQ